MPKISLEQFNQHSWARAQEMPKMSLRIGQRKCPKWISEASKRILSNHAGLDIRLRKCLRIASDATKSIFWGHAWLEKCPIFNLVSDAVFEKRANEKNEKTGTEPYPPRSEKRVKTRGFRNISKQKTRRTRCALDGTETQKMRENALFSISFWGADAPRKLPKVIWTRTLARDTLKMKCGSPKTCTRFAAKS